MIDGWFEDGFGNKFYYVDGKLHSVNDEPGAIWPDGTKSWYKEGRWHRETGPAWIYPDGRKFYYFKGEWYRDITSDLEWMMKVEELKDKWKKYQQTI
jgi:hypothetical protein